MMVSNRSSVFGLLAWQWRNSLLFVATGALAQAIYLIPRWTHLSLPPTPIAVIGGAIGIFVSFRSNHGYARWWEGRQLWGRLINNARDLGSFAVATLPPALAREVVHRQIAFEDDVDGMVFLFRLDEHVAGRQRVDRTVGKHLFDRIDADVAEEFALCENLALGFRDHGVILAQ